MKSVKRCSQQPKTTNTINTCTSLFSWPCPLQPQGPNPPPYTHFRRSIERQLAARVINGWFVTAARCFNAQKAVRCCCLLLSVVARKESPPSRSLCGPALITPLPQNTTTPTLKLATSNRKGQVLPPIHFRRGIERQPAIHKNGWFVTAIDRSGRMISGRPGIPPFQGGRVVSQGLVWVSKWLTFCKWSNGLIPPGVVENPVGRQIERADIYFISSSRVPHVHHLAPPLEYHGEGAR